MSQKGNSKLVEALCNKSLVKFWNPYDSGSTQGCILDIGLRFFLLGLVSGEMRFNGFQCLRLSDLRRVQVPDPYSDFIITALRKRGESIRRKPTSAAPRVVMVGKPALSTCDNPSRKGQTRHVRNWTRDGCRKDPCLLAGNRPGRRLGRRTDRHSIERNNTSRLWRRL